MKLIKLSQRYYYLIIGLFIILGILSRFIWLGQVPAGLTWDEAAIGYNGWSIWHTRRDEWLNRLPISFKSFGDYKAPLAIYVNGLFTYFGGLSPTTVRLPFALMGVGSILVWYFLLKSLLPKQSDELTKALMILGLTFFVLSPTLIHFSRVGFESGMALTFILCGLLCLNYSINQSRKLKCYLYLGAGAVCLALSLYTYHSAKISLPFILVTWPFLFLWHKRRYLVPYLLFVVTIVLLALPILIDSLWGSGLARASGITIFTDNLNLWQLFMSLIANTWAHFQPQFLLLGQIANIRHSALSGFVTWPVGLLFYFFVILMLFKSFRQKFWALNLTKMGVLLLVAGLLPALIGLEVPHPNRALLALPGFILLAIACVAVILPILNQWKNNLGQYLALVLMGITLISTGWQLTNYFTHYNQLSVQEFNQGYLEAVQIAREYELGLNGKPKVDQIIFDSRYGQPYIYTLFGDAINPLAYHHGALVKYLFPDQVTIGDTGRKNTLLIATNQTDLLPERATQLIYGADGKVQFMIYYLPP